MSSDTRHFTDSDVGDQWGTPSWLWEPLADALGGFDLDPAAGCEPEHIAAERYTVEDDGLTTPWFGDVWVNPPYGRPHNRPWAERIAGQATRNEVDTVTALVPASVGTNWWQDNYAGADWYTVVDGRVDGGNARVTFLDGGEAADNNASFGSLLLSFGEFSEAYFRALDEVGNFTMKRTSGGRSEP
jgi:phage N-6-adenine-methyltransferase